MEISIPVTIGTYPILDEEQATGPRIPRSNLGTRIQQPAAEVLAPSAPDDSPEPPSPSAPPPPPYPEDGNSLLNVNHVRNSSINH